MPISIFCISPLSLHCYHLEDSLNSIWSSYSWQRENPRFWSYINSPHIHKFTSLTPIHLTYINSPHIHKFTSRISIHLTFINSPHLHQFTSHTSIHLTYINSPHLHQFTSLTSIHLTFINSPHLHQFTSLTSIHLTYIRAGAISTMEKALDEYVVSGLGNNIPFLRSVYRNEK